MDAHEFRELMQSTRDTPGPFWCRGGGIDLNCAGDVTSPLLDGSTSIGELMTKLARALLLAFWIHLSLFVGELAMLTGGPSPEMRRKIDGMAHILTMPITIVSFYQADTIGTILFFASLWHFLCDCAATRPTYVLLLPGFGGRTTLLHYVRWFEACWIALHHVLIGTVKFAIDWGLIAQPKKPHGGSLLLVFIVGAGLAHLSFGMSAFGIRGSAALLVVSQILRIGADIGMSQYHVHEANRDWVVLMRGDLAWIVVMFAIRLLVFGLRKRAPNKTRRRTEPTSRVHMGVDELATVKGAAPPPELAPVPADRGPNASTLFALHDELRAVRMRNAELEAALRACRGGSRVSSDEIDDLDDLDEYLEWQEGFEAIAGSNDQEADEQLVSIVALKWRAAATSRRSQTVVRAPGAHEHSPAPLTSAFERRTVCSTFGLGEADGVAGPGPVGLAGAAPSTKAAQLERVSRAEPASINAESLAGKKELADELALTQC